MCEVSCVPLLIFTLCTYSISLFVPFIPFFYPPFFHNLALYLLGTNFPPRQPSVWPTCPRSFQVTFSRLCSRPSLCWWNIWEICKVYCKTLVICLNFSIGFLSSGRIYKCFFISLHREGVFIIPSPSHQLNLLLSCVMIPKLHLNS